MTDQKPKFEIEDTEWISDGIVGITDTEDCNGIQCSLDSDGDLHLESFENEIIIPRARFHSLVGIIRAIEIGCFRPPPPEKTREEILLALTEEMIHMIQTQKGDLHDWSCRALKVLATLISEPQL